MLLRPQTKGVGGGGVTKRIQHEDDLQRRLSHAKCGERGVPDASVLDDGDREEKKNMLVIVIAHRSYINTSQI